MLSSDQESTSIAAQTPSVYPSLVANSVIQVDPPVPIRLSVTQLSNPSTSPTQMRSFSITQPSLSFTPSAPSNLLTPVTQSMSVNSPVQMSSFTQPSLPSTPWVMSAHSPVLSNPTHSPLLSNPTGSVIQVTQPLSANQATILPPPFNTPPKLLLVEQVMRDYPRNYVASFR